MGAQSAISSAARRSADRNVISGKSRLASPRQRRRYGGNVIAGQLHRHRRDRPARAGQRGTASGSSAAARIRRRTTTGAGNVISRQRHRRDLYDGTTGGPDPKATPLASMPTARRPSALEARRPDQPYPAPAPTPAASGQHHRRDGGRRRQRHQRQRRRLAWISPPPATGNVVEGNYIGTGVTGIPAPSTGLHAFVVTSTATRHRQPPPGDPPGRRLLRHGLRRL